MWSRGYVWNRETISQSFSDKVLLSYIIKCSPFPCVLLKNEFEIRFSSVFFHRMLLFLFSCPLVLRLNGFLLKMNHTGARTSIGECSSVSRFQNLKLNCHFLPFLCSCCCCPLLPCRTSLSNLTSEPRLESK